MSTAPSWHLRVPPLLAQGLSCAVIAERLGVARCSVERVRRGMQAPAWAFEDLPPETWPALYASGTSLARIAARTELTLRRVRRELGAGRDAASAGQSAVKWPDDPPPEQ